MCVIHINSYKKIKRVNGSMAQQRAAQQQHTHSHTHSVLRGGKCDNEQAQRTATHTTQMRAVVLAGIVVVLVVWNGVEVVVVAGWMVLVVVDLVD